MAQSTKYIDLTRTYLPIDPASFPITQHATQGEDQPEGRMPVVPFEGWNFMPTAYGWRSYFGLTSKLNVNAIPNPKGALNVRESFVFQKADLSNLLVALCDDGIWTKQGESVGDWTHAVTLDDLSHPSMTDPNVVTVLEWSYCVIENVLYCYRQGAPNVYYCSAGTLYAFANGLPSTLNMAGQLGIFKAGSRLGFWDSDGSIAYSSFDNKMDVTPSISTGANITTLNDLLGSIVTIEQHSDGFIVYATKSVIGVQKNLNNPFGWQAKAITVSAGIAYRHQATRGNPDGVHFAWTSAGLMHVENFQSSFVTPELYDFLKESQDPVYLKFLEGRYLAVQVASNKYTDGFVSFYTMRTDELDITLASIRRYLPSVPHPPTVFPSTTVANATFDAFNTFPANTLVFFRANDATKIKDCGGTTDYPTFLNHYAIPMMNYPAGTASANLTAITNPVADSLNWSLHSVSLNGSTVNLGSPILPGPGTPYDTYITDTDQKGFYTKVTALWERYNALVTDVIATLDERIALIGLHAGVNNIDSDNWVAVSVPIQTTGAAGSMSCQAWTTAVVATPVNAAICDFPTTTYNLYSEVWLSYDEYTDLYFATPHPLHKTSYAFTAYANSYSRYKAPFIVTLSGFAGDGMIGGAYAFNSLATFITMWNLHQGNGGGASAYQIAGNGTIQFNTIAAANLFLTALADRNSYSADVGRTMNTAKAGAASYKFINTSGVHDAATSAAYGQSVTYTFHSGDPMDFHFDVAISSPGLESRDVVTYTRTETALADCEPNMIAAGFVSSYSYPSAYYRYDATCKRTTSPNAPAALVFNTPTYPRLPIDCITYDSCTLDPTPDDTPSLLRMPFVVPERNYSNDFGDGVIGSNTFYTEDAKFTFPSATFLMQVGTPTPYDLLWKGAYVYDTQLKRWGKMKADYRVLLDFSPINSTALAAVPYTHFGITGALLNDSNEIRLFDAQPTDSKIKFGRFGLSRQGLTALESIYCNFRQACTGTLTIEPSLDGSTVDRKTIQTYDYTDVLSLRQGIGIAGRWHNIQYSGQFDLSYLECNAWKHSRR